MYIYCFFYTHTLVFPLRFKRIWPLLHGATPRKGRRIVFEAPHVQGKTRCFFFLFLYFCWGSIEYTSLKLEMDIVRYTCYTDNPLKNHIHGVVDFHGIMFSDWNDKCAIL